MNGLARSRYVRRQGGSDAMVRSRDFLFFMISRRNQNGLYGGKIMFGYDFV